MTAAKVPGRECTKSGLISVRLSFDKKTRHYASQTRFLLRLQETIFSDFDKIQTENQIL